MKTFTEYFSDDKSVSLTAYLLDNSHEMPNMLVRPAVLVIPGGGYRMCSDREAEPIAMYFATLGYHAFVLRYTVGERGEFTFEQPYADAIKAIKYIRSNASKFGIDPQKIAAIGFSAGGHLASAIATMSEDKPNALILGYPCILDSIGDVLSCDVPSTDKYVTDKTPPTFIYSSADDNTVPIENSLAFASSCAEHNVPFEIHIFAHGRHGSSLATPFVCMDGGNRDIAKWTGLCEEWLKKYFCLNT